MLTRLHMLFKSARALLKHMGEQAGVDIEPDAQSRLAYATDSLDGVLCALVPGAGGVDALVAIALSEDVRTSVELKWQQWGAVEGNSSVCPLMLRAESGLQSGVLSHPSFPWE